MSNSNFKQKKVITPERAAIILPTIISALFVFIIMSIEWFLVKPTEKKLTEWRL